MCDVSLKENKRTMLIFTQFLPKRCLRRILHMKHRIPSGMAHYVSPTEIKKVYFY